MLFSTAVAATMLAIFSSVSAAPTEKTFKFKIQTNHGKGAVSYIGASGPVTDQSKAVDCTISSGTLACGPSSMTLSYDAGHTMHSSSHEVHLVKTQKGKFAVNDSGAIEWKDGKTVINISTTAPDAKELYPEVCNGAGHPDGEKLVGAKYVSGFVPSALTAVYSTAGAAGAAATTGTGA